MPPPDVPSDAAGEERRSLVTAAVLVGLVVLLLGFGSGIGAVWERDASARSASAPSTHTGVTQPPSLSSVVSPGVASGSADSAARTRTRTSTLGGSRGRASRGGGARVSTTVPSSRDPEPTPPTTGSPPPTTAGPPACDGSNALAAIAAPFWAHFQAAHLETSPGQQADDLVDLDSYVLAHTVLVEHMLAPVVELLDALPDALDPFFTHVDAAHLETSPGQQVAEILDIDQYVQTHTVLVERMLAPAADAITASGC